MMTWQYEKEFERFKQYSNLSLIIILLSIAISIISLVGLIVLIFEKGVNFWTCWGATMLIIMIFALLAFSCVVAGVLDEKMKG